MGLRDEGKIDQLELLHRNGLIKLLKLIENNAHNVHDQVLYEEYREVTHDIDEFFFNYDEYDSDLGGIFDGVQSIFRDVDIFHDLGDFIYEDRFKCLDCGRSEVNVVLKLDGDSYAIECKRCGFSWKEKKS